MPRAHPVLSLSKVLVLSLNSAKGRTSSWGPTDWPTVMQSSHTIKFAFQSLEDKSMSSANSWSRAWDVILLRARNVGSSGLVLQASTDHDVSPQIPHNGFPVAAEPTNLSTRGRIRLALGLMQ
ncbi:hypothetical protein, variant 2 [Phialophora macrospora]|uniref:Uncharacterized protein n=1 Tax=Phialophora macrospora TaxID=1851006 RepID=A0A0D2F3C7_9EURO|nr:hypothetical protein PV04_10578 [Phialophora macrospora]KIW62399.1 hypothetical protein, variant 1 [Phialophora macrospora]KIW62400.1 hypothetical protein, variant 2 [Phialophora macrospora]